MRLCFAGFVRYFQCDRIGRECKLRRTLVSYGEPDKNLSTSYTRDIQFIDHVILFMCEKYVCRLDNKEENKCNKYNINQDDNQTPALLPEKHAGFSVVWGLVAFAYPLFSTVIKRYVINGSVL